MAGKRLDKQEIPQHKAWQGIKERRYLFIRLAVGALTRKRPRLLIALASVMIGASVISSMSSIYLDIFNKMSKELRSYGANVAILPATNSKLGSISDTEFKNALSVIPKDKLIGAAPYLYNVADVVAGTKQQRIVVSGTDFKQVKKVTPYWQVVGSMPAVSREVLVGFEVADTMKLTVGDRIIIKQVTEQAGKAQQMPCLSCHKNALASPKKKAMRWADLQNCTTCHQPHPLDMFDGSVPSYKVTGIVTTGGPEDSQVFTTLEEAQALFKQKAKVSAAYVSVLGQTGEVQQVVSLMRKQEPSAFTQPIKRISESEGQIIFKIRSLILPIIIAILLSTILCVAITTVAMTLERRHEIGLKKALGAEDKDIIVEFLGEALILGLAGGALGWVIGFALAQWIGKAIFDAAIALRLITVPLTIAISLAMTGVASFPPVRMATGINPALVLKEE